MFAHQHTVLVALRFPRAAPAPARPRPPAPAAPAPRRTTSRPTGSARGAASGRCHAASHTASPAPPSAPPTARAPVATKRSMSARGQFERGLPAARGRDRKAVGRQLRLHVAHEAAIGFLEVLGQVGVRPCARPRAHLGVGNTRKKCDRRKGAGGGRGIWLGLAGPRGGAVAGGEAARGPVYYSTYVRILSYTLYF